MMTSPPPNSLPPEAPHKNFSKSHRKSNWKSRWFSRFKNSEPHLAEHEEEINQNREDLIRQGVTFHYNRSQKKSIYRSHPNQKVPLEASRYWKVAFSFCCIAVMLYYVIVLFL